MPDRVHGLHRADEALHFFLVGCKLWQQHLDGHVAILFGVPTVQDDAGAALREHPGDLVVVDLLADQGRAATAFGRFPGWLGGDCHVGHSRALDPHLRLANLDHVARSHTGVTGRSAVDVSS